MGMGTTCDEATASPAAMQTQTKSTDNLPLISFP